MTCCDSVRGQLDAFWEGLTDGEETRVIDQHLNTCADCRTFVEQTARIANAVLEFAEDNWNPPRGLWERIQQSHQQQSMAAMKSSGISVSLMRWVAVAMLVLGIGLITLVRVPEAYPDPNQLVANTLVNEFHTFVVSGRSLDYDHSEPRAIREWFADKVDFRVPWPALPAGFDLSGGRLCHLLDQRIAAFMYLSGEAWISLYILKPDTKNSADTRQAVSLVQGYGYIQWIREGLQYSLVGDIPLEQLRLFAERFQQPPFAAARPALRVKRIQSYLSSGDPV